MTREEFYRQVIAYLMKQLEAAPVSGTENEAWTSSQVEEFVNHLYTVCDYALSPGKEEFEFVLSVLKGEHHD